MAKQHGPILLTGQLGGVSFYKMKGKYYARKKTEHDVANDPKFIKTYLSSLDFGTATRASRLLRSALGKIITPCSDTYIASRLTGRFVKVVHADASHAWGSRKVLNANLALLTGFQFNKHKAFDASGFTTALSKNKATGAIEIKVCGSITKRTAPLTAGIVCVNFKKGTYTRHSAKLIHNGEKNGIAFQAPITADSKTVVIVTLGSAQSGAMAIVGAHQITALTTRPLNHPVSKSIALINPGNHHNPKNHRSENFWFGKLRSCVQGNAKLSIYHGVIVRWRAGDTSLHRQRIDSRLHDPDAINRNFALKSNGNGPKPNIESTSAKDHHERKERKIPKTVPGILAAHVPKQI